MLVSSWKKIVLPGIPRGFPAREEYTLVCLFWSRQEQGSPILATQYV